MKNHFKIAITTGDINGIGTEITAKALAKLRPQKNIQFYVWRSKKTSPRELKMIDRYFKRTTVTSWSE